MDLKKIYKDIGIFQRRYIFKEITTLLNDSMPLNIAVDLFVDLYKGQKIDLYCSS
jgi:adenine/guanine phosphoribosyltransferase-like PRPP-binding protein